MHCAHLYSLLYGFESYTRTAADEAVNLSGWWSDTDSRLMAETMVESMLSEAWLNWFLSDETREPAVKIGRIQNKSSEPIDTHALAKNIGRELVNSGRIAFFAGGEERRELRTEEENQQSNATQETSAALAAKTGANRHGNKPERLEQTCCSCCNCNCRGIVIFHYYFKQLSFEYERVFLSVP